MADVSTMIRTALIVSDLDRSARFYEEMFGLSEVYAQGELSHDAGAKLLGMPGTVKIRYRILKAEKNLNRGMVGLFELTNPRPPTVEKQRKSVNVGDACLVFYCADLDAVYRKLVAGGHMVLCPPTHLQVTAAKGQPEMTFFDPDGVLINLIQRDPSNPN
jgi:catechol 2,3-dioxygenase-like lactoylglutathione lyase family enzyme